MQIEEFNKITEKIIGIAFDIHKSLGPGFNEKIYAEALEEEFIRNGIKSEREKNIQVNYKGRFIGEQRVDFLISEEVIVELKTVDSIGKIHLAQMLSYLKTLDKHLGLVLNFATNSLEMKLRGLKPAVSQSEILSPDCNRGECIKRVIK